MKLITTSNAIEIVQKEDILYIEAYQNYTKVYMKDGKMILSKDNLSLLKKELGSLFYRIHNSFVINIIHLRRYYKIGEVELYMGTILPVARRRRADFIEALMSTARVLA